MVYAYHPAKIEKEWTIFMTFNKVNTLIYKIFCAFPRFILSLSHHIHLEAVIAGSGSGLS